MMGCLESLSRMNDKCEISRLSPQSHISLNDTIPYRAKVVQEVLASCGCPLHCYPPSWEEGLLFQGLVELNLNYDPSASVLILNKNQKIQNDNDFFESSRRCCKHESPCKHGATCSVVSVARGTLRRGCGGRSVCRVAYCTACAASSWSFHFTIDQLRGLLGGNTLPQRGGA